MSRSQISAITLRMLVSGSCIETRLTPLMPSVSRRCCSEQRLDADALDQARFARRHLRDDRGEDRVLAPRDRGHLHEGVVFLQVDVAVRFAERRLGLEVFGVDEALDDDLGFRRHQQIDGLRLHDVDRRADQAAGDVQLVERLGQLLRRGEGDAGRRAEHDRAGSFLRRALALLPVGVDAGPQLERRIHAEPARAPSPGRGSCPCSARRSRDPW